MKSFKEFLKEVKSQNRYYDTSTTVGKASNFIFNKDENNTTNSSQVNRDQKRNTPEYNNATTNFVNDTITGKSSTRLSPMHYNNMTPIERTKQNDINRINSTIKEPISRSGLVDARTNSPYKPQEPEQVPLTGRVKYNDDKSNIVPDTSPEKGPSNRSAEISNTDSQTIVKKGDKLPNINENYMKRLLNKPVSSVGELAKKHKVDVEQIEKQRKMGIEVEGEHSTNKKVARRIALAHIGEDPKYYDKLKKIEKK